VVEGDDQAFLSLDVGAPSVRLARVDDRRPRLPRRLRRGAGIPPADAYPNADGWLILTNCPIEHSSPKPIRISVTTYTLTTAPPTSQDRTAPTHE
jgi:hypothetical protein